MSSILHDKAADASPAEPADAEQLVRQQAIRQIERKRRFRLATISSTLAMLVLAAIWAITEYHNAGGWPTRGFSQSSGIHDVWNIWIIYPAIAWVFITSAHAWSVFWHKPISENEIRREIQRQAR